MRIAFIGQKGIPATQGGVEKHVEKLATRLVQRGNEVIVYVRNNYTDKNIREYDGIKLIHLPSIPTKHLDAISHTFLATIHAIFSNYDIVHYQAIGPSSLALLFKIFRPRTPLVATFHCQDYHHQKWGRFAQVYLKFGEYIACKIPDKTVVMSEILKKYAKEKYGIEAVVIPTGAESFKNENEEALKFWDLRDKKYVVSVSRLIRHKGLQYLIEAFKQLEDTNRIPNSFKLVIIGDGFHTDEYVNQLHSLTEGRGNIIFTGSQAGSSLEQLFSHAYLFVQPSESEGLSMALLEAMDYGLAPLVSDIPENIEPVGTNGYFFRNKDVADLRDKLAYLISDPEEVLKMGTKAKEHVRKEYSWDSITGKTLAVYEELICKKKVSHAYECRSKEI